MIGSSIIVSFISNNCGMLILVNLLVLPEILFLAVGKQSCLPAFWVACRRGLLQQRACCLSVLALFTMVLVLISSEPT